MINIIQTEERIFKKKKNITNCCLQDGAQICIIINGMILNKCFKRV